MDCATIAQRAGSQIDESIDDAAFILAVLNEFQEDITYRFAQVDIVTLAVTSGVWYDLPANMIALYVDQYGDYGVTDDDGGLTPFQFRELHPKRQIRFFGDGTRHILYERSPNNLLALTDELDMHPYLQSLGVYYLASRYKSMDDDENKDALRLMKEYEDTKIQRVAKLANPQNEEKRVMVE